MLSPFSKKGKKNLAFLITLNGSDSPKYYRSHLMAVTLQKYYYL